MATTVFYRIGVLMLLSGILWMTHDLYLEYRNETALINGYRARVADVEDENRALYAELIKINGDLEAAREQVYKMETMLKLAEPARATF